MKRLLLMSLLLASCLATAQATITVASGQSYDSINSTVRTYGLWYNASLNPATMPIAVFIHGGAWSGGTAYGYASFAPTTCNFAGANTVLCGLANAGYAVYSINYTLVQSGNSATLWPAQWQDCDCFLKFLAEEAGTPSVPGNPQDIHIFGHSAGAHLTAMVTLAPHTAFPTNCGHVSLGYTVKAAMLFSPPIDLRQMWNGKSVQGGIAGLLGCTPSSFATPTCLSEAISASPQVYVGQNQVPLLVESGLGDTSVPYQYQGLLQESYGALSPPVNTPWTTLPATFFHDLDLFYFNPCSADSDPGSEPSPCGAAGRAYKDLVTFFAANP